MPEVVRNKSGQWCVAVTIDGRQYGTAHNVRRLYRIPVDRRALRSDAEHAARVLRMIGDGNGKLENLG